MDKEMAKDKEDQEIELKHLIETSPRSHRVVELLLEMVENRDSEIKVLKALLKRIGEEGT